MPTQKDIKVCMTEAVDLYIGYCKLVKFLNVKRKHLGILQ